tara:strand:- start:1156 stop:2208 length:1053 start_codon:yes stop_codon:yes gene_type:complete
MKTILITGGTGFIGSHTCLSLLENNFKIVVVDSNVNSSKLSLQRIKKILEQKKFSIEDILFIKGDIRDEKFIKNVFIETLKKGFQIDGVVHFAGLKSVEESTQNPLLYWDNNILGTLNLLKVMNIFNCKTIVFSSSATIYGNSKINPIKETFEIKPFNPYGNTKATVENMLSDISKAYGNDWRIANLRYFNPIGAHESGLIGEEPINKPNNLFPYICLVANGRYEKLNIYGKNWPTHDGTGIRDYIHVMDLAEAHKCAIKYLFDNGPNFLNLNIGTGVGISVLELVETFEKVNKCKIPYEFCNRRPGDVPTIIADNEKAISLLQWHPKRDLKDMCEDGWRWRKLNPNGYE